MEQRADHRRRLAERAVEVLRRNDLGEMTTAAPALYPHLWSWDAAVVSVGWAWVSVPRALTELRTLLRAQWGTGMLPHIVFSEEPGYFPGPDRWGTDLAAAAPHGVRTSGICQPPLHALALGRILAIARARGGNDRLAAESFVAETFDAWLAWHRWLARVRDPDGVGLLEVFHGWESGMDNSPRWDGPYAAVVPGAGMAPFERRDTAHVADAAQRPTDEEYGRYVWLVDQMRAVRYDAESMREAVDFRVRDVFMSALLSVASEVLAELGEEVGRGDDAAELRGIARRFRSGVCRTVSPRSGLARDFDVRADAWIETDTVAGLAPLLCGGEPALVRAQRDFFWGEHWCGHPRLRYALPPSTSPTSADLSPRAYWRGPVWPVLNWLFAWSFARHGDAAAAVSLRDAALEQLAAADFGEYYEPFTGEPLGSLSQSWTAAVALDWLGAGRSNALRGADAPPGAGPHGPRTGAAGPPRR